MTEERDIVKFALPFTIGISTAWLFQEMENGLSNSCISIFLILSFSAMMSGRFRFLPKTLQWSAIYSTVFLTGTICFIAALHMETSSVVSRTFAEGFCDRLNIAIDSIAFRNDETAPLLKALITGNRTALTPELSAAFRKSGASHILALSGMHLGIVYGLMAKLLSPMGNTGRAQLIRSFTMISACGYYTLATGSGESMTRAFLFILLHESASILNRKTSLEQILYASLIIQLATDPLDIRSVSFQLSYAAMAGIAHIHPHLSSFWPQDGRNIFRRIWESASLSISCQITTGPLAWLYFRSFPSHFLLANLIAAPLTGVIITSALALLAADAMGFCPQILVKLTELSVSIMTGALKTIASM